MSSLLKDLYSRPFYKSLCGPISKIGPRFDEQTFLKRIFTSSFQQMELKERITHTTVVLHHYMPQDFPTAANKLGELIDHIKAAGIKPSSIEFLFLAEYISTYGLNDRKAAVKAMEVVTRYITCEFAIRPFILKYEEEMMVQMLKWSKHADRHIRRLSTEGCRPRLPWAMGIPSLKKDPTSILPILENLKADSCESVRRSVANNLNDISKDHPKLAIQIAKRWKGSSAETDALIKHGLRTLLKQSNPEVLAMYRLKGEKIEIDKIRLHTPKVNIGGHLHFSFNIRHTGKGKLPVRIEYAIHYLRSNGSLSKKVFKISERELGTSEELSIERRQSFKPITTRVFYPGKQQFSIIVNGKETQPFSFHLEP